MLFETVVIQAALRTPDYLLFTVMLLVNFKLESLYWCVAKKASNLFVQANFFVLSFHLIRDFLPTTLVSTNLSSSFTELVHMSFLNRVSNNFSAISDAFYLDSVESAPEGSVNLPQRFIGLTASVYALLIVSQYALVACHVLASFAFSWVDDQILANRAFKVLIPGSFN